MNVVWRVIVCRLENKELYQEGYCRRLSSTTCTISCEGLCCGD